MSYFRIRFISVLLIASLALFVGPAAGLSDTGKEAKKSAPESIDRSKQVEPSGEAAQRKLPQLEPGEWAPLFELGESIYPSVVISTSTMKGSLWDDKDFLGDPYGTIGVAVRGTEDNCPVKVEISGEGFVKPTVFTGTLADKAKVYRIYPRLKYDYEKLLAVKQTVPEMLNFKVTIADKAGVEENMRVQVRPVNECVYSFTDSSGNTNDISIIFAAYVNENHPFINQILKEAIQSGKIDSFSGYSGDPDNRQSVISEIQAVWATLQDRGIHYSSMPASADDDNPYLGSQYVRLLGESINYTQANCVDGSVLMASIFRKIGLNASLIEVPEHMFVGISLDPEGKEFIYIETTDLGQSTFEEALKDGQEGYDKGRGKFDSEKDDDQEYNIINIQEARLLGVMPIKDAAAKKIVDKGNHPTVIREEEEDTEE